MFGCDANDATIGVEYCYGSNINSNEAYKRYIWVMAYICYKFNLDPKKSIVGHFILDPGRKSDPRSGLLDSQRTYEQMLKDVVTEYEDCLTNNIKEDDEPMTQSEKQEFEKLQQTVKNLKNELDALANSKDVLKKGIQEQGSSIKNVKERVESLENKHSMNIPTYAKEAVEALTNLKDQCGNPVVNTPEGRSADFYSLVTVLYRAGLFKSK